MTSATDFVVPAIILLILGWGICKGVAIFDVFVAGAADGLKVGVSIAPALVALLTAVAMFKASGGLDVLTHALTPLGNLLGLPREVLPLALLRPISGSGALALFQDVLNTWGPDSLIGRVASVIQGSTETTH